MGGIGSGQYWRHGSKETIEDYMPLDIRRWTQEGLLTPGRFFGWQRTCNDRVIASIRVQVETNRVILIYRHRSGGGDWKDEKYPVCLEWTPCNFGGHRPWFLCPAKGCGRRVAVLYGGGIFACRRCRQLAYPSQRETGYDRAARRADKIRARLDWEQGILNPKGWKKPKGMHWRTFERLNVEHDAYVAESLNGMAQHLELFERAILDFDQICFAK